MYGATPRGCVRINQMLLFQPTPRMYGATHRRAARNHRGIISTHAPYVRGDPMSGTGYASGSDFNPRPVCTGRPRAVRAAKQAAAISTHAPYVRGDHLYFVFEIKEDIFQPTPRMYGATYRLD